MANSLQDIWVNPEPTNIAWVKSSIAEILRDGLADADLLGHSYQVAGESTIKNLKTVIVYMNTVHPSHFENSAKEIEIVEVVNSAVDLVNRSMDDEHALFVEARAKLLRDESDPDQDIPALLALPDEVKRRRVEATKPIAERITDLKVSAFQAASARAFEANPLDRPVAEPAEANRPDLGR